MHAHAHAHMHACYLRNTSINSCWYSQPHAHAHAVAHGKAHSQLMKCEQVNPGQPAYSGTDWYCRARTYERTDRHACAHELSHKDSVGTASAHTSMRPGVKTYITEGVKRTTRPINLFSSRLPHLFFLGCTHGDDMQSRREPILLYFTLFASTVLSSGIYILQEKVRRRDRVKDGAKQIIHFPIRASTV